MALSNDAAGYVAFGGKSSGTIYSNFIAYLVVKKVGEGDFKHFYKFSFSVAFPWYPTDFLQVDIRSKDVNNTK